MKVSITNKAKTSEEKEYFEKVEQQLNKWASDNKEAIDKVSYDYLVFGVSKHYMDENLKLVHVPYNPFDGGVHGDSITPPVQDDDIKE